MSIDTLDMIKNIKNEKSDVSDSESSNEIKTLKNIKKNGILSPEYKQNLINENFSEIKDNQNSEAQNNSTDK